MVYFYSVGYVLDDYLNSDISFELKSLIVVGWRWMLTWILQLSTAESFAKKYC